MKKKTFLIAALALSMSSVAFAGEKVQTDEKCCRADDEGCTTAYVSSCDEQKNVGHFCSTAKDDSGNKLDYRVVWDFTCTSEEKCTNTDGNISCTKTVDDAELPTGKCDASTDKVGCTTSGNGYYCNSKTSEWGYKVCNQGETCSVSGTSVQCLPDGAPTGECKADDENLKGVCTGDTGWYCGKKNTWVSKKCTGCKVNDKEANSVTCDGDSGSSSGGDSGPSSGGNECTDGDVGCNSKTEGWYCSKGVKKSKTCSTDQVCGTKIYKEKKSVTCCVENGGSWVDAKYSKDVCEYVYADDGSGSSGTCSEANHCSPDNKLAYNCVSGKMQPTACMNGQTCQMDGDKAKCVGSINPGSNGGDKDDDDSGCSATGAGLMLGWLGLALVPALRRRKK